MFGNNDLEQILTDQKELFLKKDCGIIRNIDFKKYISHKGIVVISGIRRCGKSTLLSQFKSHYSHFTYVNFDDDRFIGFSHDNFQTLLTLLLKQEPLNQVFFFDEIQNINGWERFVRRLHDQEYKVYVTGSNATLLSSELGTHLTGRYVKIELWPFSFSEQLRIRQIPTDRITTHVRAQILAELDKFLKGGGFPEYVITHESEFVKRTYADILYRDIVARYGIRNISGLRILGHYLMTHYTGEITYHSLCQVTGLKSDTSVRNFIRYFTDAYLVFECFSYDFSLKRLYQGPKKAYVIDSGMRNLLSLKFSDDRVRALENQVYIELMRRGLEIWFFKGDGECDFVVSDGSRFFCIQVCSEMNIQNTEREISGLKEAMDRLHVSEGIILTIDQNELPGRIKNDDTRITIMPVWEWFLKDSLPE
jgi:predicted AAA+ superfamily ATPase